MDKILTVSVAAYNVEKFIRNTLDSCIAEEIMTDLEVLVVDDGATDTTAEIVREYENKYPQTFRLIHKENGGYGTTVNRSMQEASGKYFRLLDGDDWFDTDGLKKLVSYLRDTDVDAVFTKMYLCYPDTKKLEADTWASLVGQQMPLYDVPENVFAGMWEFTVKTAILREYPFTLPARTLYTDHLFLAYPIPYIEDVAFLDFPLYCYRLGYDEQSVSISSRLKHLDEIVRVSQVMSSNFHKHRDCKNRHYLLERTRFCFMEAFRALLLPNFSRINYNQICAFIEQTDSIDSAISSAAWNGPGNRAFRVVKTGKYCGYLAIKAKQFLKSKTGATK